MDDTLAIYDTMQFLTCDVATYCVGQAASGAAMILAAGTKGKRFALPHSKIMIHQPWGGVTGQAADIQIQAEEILKAKRLLNELLAKHTGQAVEQIEQETERDRYMSPAGGQGLRPRGRDPSTRSRAKKRQEEAKKQSPRPWSRRHDRQPAPRADRHREDRPRRAELRHLLAACCSDRIIFVGGADRRRRGQRHRRPAAVPLQRGRQGRHPHVHQLPRRQHLGRAGHLRHDAVHPPRRGHLLRRAWPPRMGGRAAGRRAPRASGSSCPTAAC